MLIQFLLRQNAANLKNALVESLVGLSLMVQARAGIHWKSLMTTWLKRIIKHRILFPAYYPWYLSNSCIKDGLANKQIYESYVKDI